MPLSDAARRLLAARSGRLEPEPDEPLPSDDPDADENVDAEELARRKGFRERAAREDERFRLATDSEFWLCFCFRHPDDPAKFLKALDLQAEGRFIPGPKLVAATQGRTIVRKAKDRARAMLAAQALGGRNGESIADRMTAQPFPDPLANVKPTGSLQGDAAAELDALQAAFMAPPRHDPSRIHDSPHWLVAYFASREEKEAFLGTTGLDVLGDKYLDGNQAARTLHLTL
ncbi:hypothetical protein [Actinoallomurus sp. NPDC052274]|uniref:hypothetical protein n=1 Tax=Actinoallomurus sp. NPDC052274 TaxID=3155420 RepID=UPI00342B6B18